MDLKANLEAQVADYTKRREQSLRQLQELETTKLQLAGHANACNGAIEEASRILALIKASEENNSAGPAVVKDDAPEILNA